MLSGKKETLTKKQKRILTDSLLDNRAATVLAGVACNVTAESCMYGDYPACSNSSIQITKEADPH